MSRFTLVVDFPREEIGLFRSEFLRFIEQSPNVMRHYRHDESHSRKWRERQEKLSKGELEPEVPSIKFRFYLFDHVEALKRRAQLRRKLDDNIS
jgi:hypothetical protein